MGTYALWMPPDEAVCRVVHSAAIVRDPSDPSAPGAGYFPTRPPGHIAEEWATGWYQRGRSPHLWTRLWTTGKADVGTPAADDLWAKVAAAVRAQLSEATWNTWFQGVHALDLTENTLVLGVPSSVTVERVRTSYLGLLADAAQALTGVPLAVELIVDTAPRGEEFVAPDALARSRPCRPSQPRSGPVPPTPTAAPAARCH